MSHEPVQTLCSWPLCLLCLLGFDVFWLDRVLDWALCKCGLDLCCWILWIGLLDWLILEDCECVCRIVVAVLVHHYVLSDSLLQAVCGGANGTCCSTLCKTSHIDIHLPYPGSRPTTSLWESSRPILQKYLSLTDLLSTLTSRFPCVVTSGALCQHGALSAVPHLIIFN